MKMPVKSSWTWKPTYTLARLMVGDHHSVNRRLGIWFRPLRCAFVSFLYSARRHDSGPQHQKPRHDVCCVLRESHCRGCAVLPEWTYAEKGKMGQRQQMDGPLDA